jgi:hypothetical protein
MLPDPGFSTVPAQVCENIAAQFIPNQTVNVSSYDWTFGDGSFNASASPFHSYSPAMTYNTKLVITDIFGCVDSLSSSIIVNPNPIHGPISVLPDNNVCYGDTVTLSADLGYTYLWNTGETTQVIDTDTSGVFYVTVTDVNGCTAVPDSVVVTVFENPKPTITGPNYICGIDCITLTGSIGFGYTYQWLDNNMDSIPLQTNNTTLICNPGLISPVYLRIKDINGCIATSDSFEINVAAIPDVNIMAADTLCAGEPNLLQVFPILPNTTYQWSDGTTGTGIVAFIEGTYTVIATDTISNCKNSASIVVHGLPDLCYVPTGCYSMCLNDTLCGPLGLTEYQWNKNNVPIPGAITPQYVVMMPGSYSLTGTNIWGCSETSDTLILETEVCCESGDTDVTAFALPPIAECCFSFDYLNNIDGLFYLNLKATNADVSVDFGSIDPSLSITGTTTNSVNITSATGGSQIPPGSVNGFIDLCFSNNPTDTIEVIISWSDSLNEIVCMDTLSLVCPPDPPCLFMDQDTMICTTVDVEYHMSICNPPGADFNVGYINVTTLSPVAGLLTPNPIILGSPLLPGQCTTLVYHIDHSYANQFLCYNIAAHEADPLEVPNAECCELDTTYCVFIPGCGPCDSLYVYSVDQVVVGEDSCCFNVTIDNYHDGDLYTGVDLCVLTQGNNLNLNNPTNFPWRTVGLSNTTASLVYQNPFDSTIPLGQYTLPTICIDEDDIPNTTLELKWKVGDDVVCQDSIDLLCADCGYVDYDIYCENGVWYIDYTFYNNTGYTINNAYLDWGDPTLAAYNTTITFGALPPQGSFGPVTITIGAPAESGQELCAQFYYHTIDNLICCDFKEIIVLPECNGDIPSCACDRDFYKKEDEGLVYSFSFLTGFFSPVASFNPECDILTWDFSDGQHFEFNIDTPFAVDFENPGEYSVCLTVIRSTPKGKECKIKILKYFDIQQISPSPNIWPNPTVGNINVLFQKDYLQKVKIDVFNGNGLMMMTGNYQTDATGRIILQTQTLNPGLYTIRMRIGEDVWYERFFMGN